MLYVNYISIKLGEINYRDIVREEGGGGREMREGGDMGIYVYV